MLRISLSLVLACLALGCGDTDDPAGQANNLRHYHHQLSGIRQWVAITRLYQTGGDFDSIRAVITPCPGGGTLDITDVDGVITMEFDECDEGDSNKITGRTFQGVEGVGYDLRFVAPDGTVVSTMNGAIVSSVDADGNTVTEVGIDHTYEDEGTIVSGEMRGMITRRDGRLFGGLRYNTDLPVYEDLEDGDGSIECRFDGAPIPELADHSGIPTLESLQAGAETLFGSLAQACPPPVDLDEAPAPWPAPPPVDITVCGWSNGDVNTASCNYISSCMGDCDLPCLAEEHEVQITGSGESPLVVFDTSDSVGYTSFQLYDPMMGEVGYGVRTIDGSALPRAIRYNDDTIPNTEAPSTYRQLSGLPPLRPGVKYRAEWSNRIDGAPTAAHGLVFFVGTGDCF